MGCRWGGMRAYLANLARLGIGGEWARLGSVAGEESSRARASDDAWLRVGIMPPGTRSGQSDAPPHRTLTPRNAITKNIFQTLNLICGHRARRRHVIINRYIDQKPRPLFLALSCGCVRNVMQIRSPIAFRSFINSCLNPAFPHVQSNTKSEPFVSKIGCSSFPF